MSLLILCSPGRLHAQRTPPCAPINEKDRLRVLHSVERLFHTEPVLPVIDEERFVTGTCFWQISVSVPNSDRHWVLYLSPDRRFLSGTLLDISTDPVDEEKQLSVQLKEQAEKDRAPTRGSDAALVNVVVFSDFQCSYCAAFSEIAERYRRQNPERIRLVFRNLSLLVHDWATPAARAGVCISKQSPSAFWKFHDLLFSKQKSITAESLPATLSGFIASTPELQSDDYSECMASTFPQNRLDQDLAEARSFGIEATPTVFINGRRYIGFRDDAAFALAINLATPAEEPSKVDNAPKSKN